MSRNFAGGQGVNPFAATEQKKSSAGTEDKLEFKMRINDDEDTGDKAGQQAHLVELLTARLLAAKLPDDAQSGDPIIQENWITGDILIYRKDALNDIGFAFCADGSVTRHHPSMVVSRSAVLPAGTFDFEWVKAVYASKFRPENSLKAG